MKSLFWRAKSLEEMSTEFLKVTKQACQVFLKGLRLYLEDSLEAFEEAYSEISRLENQGDYLRREIENQLYTKTLIPESRGDVLALLENIDNITNQAKQILMELSVEIPKIPPIFHQNYLELGEKSVKAVDEVLLATQAFLNDPLVIQQSLTKVYYWEGEADDHSEKLKRRVFRTPDLELAHKFHLRYFALHIELLADRAEDVADRLSIYTIKRSL
jgi:predicted phosphate transport protein (TIGR00153 family)